MKKPMSNKSPEMKKFIESMFPGTAKAIEEGRCPTCGNKVGPFRDKLSEKEYEINGMCQNCQDETYGV